MTLARLAAIGGWWRRRAENVLVALLATMFVCFMLQISFRYVLGRPLGWTEEVSVMTWVWGVLWGAAFVVGEAHEIRFDLIYSAVTPSTRRVFTILTSIALIVVYGLSLPTVLQYVAFMKAEKSAYLGLRLDLVYSVFAIFATASMVRYAILGWNAIRGRPTFVEAGRESAL